MFRLVHISDIHLGPLPRLTARELTSKRITGYVNWHRNRRKRMFGNILETLVGTIKTAEPDHIAITGDLVNLAARAEIDTVAAWLKTIGRPEGVSVVPGNHDAYVPGALKLICDAWQPFMRGDEDTVSAGAGSLFPYFRRRQNIALIGLSTALATPPFMASGLFDRHQGERLRDILMRTQRDGLFRVVMIHHPPVRGATTAHKRMLGIGRFGRILRDHGAELVIHGHTHLDTLYRLDGKTGTVPVVGVPAAGEGRGGRRPPSGYNLFTIDGRPGEWLCRLERHGLDETGDKFEILSSQKL
ncbi:MAG: metallophosphoesterase [Pseudomonadota bacterium]